MPAPEKRLHEIAQLMPALHRWPEEAARIGRIIAAFGELEYIIALCLGNVLNDRDAALRALFRLMSDRSRLDVADALLRPTYKNMELETRFGQTMGAVRYCRSIRNQYAHCHYGDQLGYGLFLTNLGDAADAKGDFEYLWLHIDVPLLDKQEQYFLYTMQCLQYMHDEYMDRSGKSRVPHFCQWPKAIRQPPKHNPLGEHIPPWIGEDAQRRHAERAAKIEKS